MVKEKRLKKGKNYTFKMNSVKKSMFTASRQDNRKAFKKTMEVLSKK